MANRLSRPSAHDVARVAGVSQAAVSRAFTPGASIAPATRERVFRAAKTLSYRPNLLARSLIKGESGIIGVLLGSASNSLFASALDSLSMRLSQAGKHILIFTAPGGSTADVHAEDLLEYRVDALMLMGARMSETLAQECYDEGIPIVTFNRPPRKIKSFASVSGNNRDGAQRIADHMLQQGYRRIALMGGYAQSLTGRERETAFVAYLASQGVPQPEREIGYFRRDGAMHAARSLLTRKPRPDAIFCANDLMALATIEVARHEFGLAIGREIGIAGFDDIAEAAWPSFDLTTYSLPLDTMIAKVVDILLATPRPQQQPLHLVVDGVLQIRGSTRRTGAGPGRVAEHER